MVKGGSRFRNVEHCKPLDMAVSPRSFIGFCCHESFKANNQHITFNPGNNLEKYAKQLDSSIILK